MLWPQHYSTPSAIIAPKALDYVYVSSPAQKSYSSLALVKVVGFPLKEKSKKIR